MNEPALILVVDDHDASRFAKAERIRRAGYRVMEAASGHDALELADRESPDLVLLDVNLPDVGGFEVCRRLKASGAVPSIQVLHLSSTSISDADRARGLTGGADAYLTEPIHADVLLATMEALLRVWRVEAALAESVAKEQEAREIAERANHFKDDFLAALSHELRTPLSAMVGWIWQLRHGIADERLRERALDALDRSTTLQVRLINDLLDVSRISKGKIDLELGHVDLPKLIEAAVESLQSAVRAKKLVLTVSIAPASVLGDATRLHQVLVNLLTNAIQFSTEHGSIDVSLTASSREAVIKVRDTGQGIPPDVLPHIFEQFRQGERGFGRRHGGLGLGLAIARQLVTLHGGTVQAESKGPGQGALLTVRLPLRRAELLSDGRPTTPVSTNIRGARVLVVDDDGDSRGWLTAILTAAQGDVTAAASPAQALECLDSHTFDLFVGDIGMPEQDGLSLLRAIRQRGHTMPAIAVTAFSAAEERQRILAAGYQEHLAKPIRPDEFIERAAELLAESSGHTPPTH